MPTIETVNVGYKGSGGINSVGFLVTGGQVSFTQDVIESSGNWGANSNNAGIIAFASNYMRGEGSLSYDLTAAAFGAISSFAVSDRETNTPVTVCTSSNGGYSGNGYCTSFNFNASEGSLVTGDVGFMTDSIGGSAQPLVAGDHVVFAYWQTSAESGNISGDSISWSIGYNADIQLLYPCDGSTTVPRMAKYILLGNMSGTGSITMFGTSALSISQAETTLTVQTGAGPVRLPRAIVTSVSSSIQTGASYVTSDISFNGYGDGSVGPVSFS